MDLKMKPTPFQPNLIIKSVINYSIWFFYIKFSFFLDMHYGIPSDPGFDPYDGFKQSDWLLKFFSQSSELK